MSSDGDGGGATGDGAERRPAPRGVPRAVVARRRRRRGGATAAALAVITLGAGPAAALGPFEVVSSTVPTFGGQELDRAAVRVGREVQTFSGLVREARLALYRCELGSLDGPCPAAKGLRGAVRPRRFLDEPEERAAVLRALAGDEQSPIIERSADLVGGVLAYAVRRRLLVAEARRLELRSATAEEVQEELSRLAGFGLGRRSIRRVLRELAELGFDDRAVPGTRIPRSVFALLSAELLARQVAALRLRSAPRVRAADLARCSGGRPTTEAQRARLAAAMRRAKAEAVVRATLARLEERADVVYAPPFTPRPLPEPGGCPPESEWR